MSTQSKSILVPFMIIAALIFLGALGWKMMNNDVEPATDKTTVDTSSETVKTTAKPAKMPEIEVVKYESPEPLSTAPVTKEEIKKVKKRAINFMQYSLQYSTADEAIEGLRDFVNNNDEEKALNMLAYIEETFPNASIPAELLDF